MVLFCLQCWWGEVRNIVRCIYREAGTSLAGKWLFYDLLLSTCNYLFINCGRPAEPAILISTLVSNACAAVI